VSNSGQCTPAVSDLGNGWLRVSMTFTTTAAGSFAGVIALVDAAGTGRGASTAVASGSEKSLLLCNAQLVAGGAANAF
jgi:hypothetical protein